MLNMEKAAILLVQDNPDEEALTSRTLKKNNIGHMIIGACHSAEARDFLFCTGACAGRDPHETPELILPDLRLPKVDGLEVLRRIRANAGKGLLAFVILTSSDQEKDLMEVYQYGVNSCTRKPVDFTQFVESVRQLDLSWLVLNETPALRKDG
jgi:two-component system response regulator